VNLLNGKSKFDCDPASDPRCTGTGGEWFEVLFHEGTTYKLNIINSRTLFTYNFWIDGHDITVLSTDFVPIEPYKTNILNCIWTKIPHRSFFGYSRTHHFSPTKVSLP